jgi:hypothetical protein
LSDVHVYKQSHCYHRKILWCSGIFRENVVIFRDIPPYSVIFRHSGFSQRPRKNSVFVVFYESVTWFTTAGTTLNATWTFRAIWKLHATKNYSDALAIFRLRISWECAPLNWGENVFLVSLSIEAPTIWLLYDSLLYMIWHCLLENDFYEKQ